MTDIPKIFDSFQESNQQVLINISQLQNQEKELYNRLDDVTLSYDQKRMIIDRINQIYQIRMNLYDSLKDMFSYYNQNINASNTTLSQSIDAVNVLEDELNNTKIKMGLIDEVTNSKQRLVEINTYYGKRYSAYSKLMKTIVFICIPIIILAFLANKGIIPTNIYMILCVIIFVIGAVLLGLQLIDISNRDDMNWDEYDWYFDKSTAPEPSKDPAANPTTNSSTNSSTNPWTLPTFTCVGNECCYTGSVYNVNTNTCVPTV